MQNSQSSSKQTILIVVAIIAILLVGGFFFVRHRQSDNGAVIRTFVIENAATPGQSSSDFAQEQLKVGDQARLRFTYDPAKISAVSVRFVASNGSTVRTSKTTPLGQNGSANIVERTDDLAADSYRVELLDQNRNVVDYGALTLIK